MIDRYTKAILTVIALALTVLCIQNATKVAVAQLGDCGSLGSACPVKNESLGGMTIPLQVRVVN